jgi:hypothetical protein
MMSNRQVGYIAAYKLDWELGIDRGVCGRYGRVKGAWIIGGCACVGCG